MKHLISNLLYKSVSTGTWRSMGMIPGSGALEITTDDTENGPVSTYSLTARVSRAIRRGDASLDGDLVIRIQYDSDRWEELGTDEVPARLKVTDGDTVQVSCTWKKPSRGL